MAILHQIVFISVKTDLNLKFKKNMLFILENKFLV